MCIRDRLSFLCLCLLSASFKLLFLCIYLLTGRAFISSAACQRQRETHKMCIRDSTTSGHFLVLTGVDDSGKILLKDPNSRIRTEKAWDVEDLMAQIRNLWAYSY